MSQGWSHLPLPCAISDRTCQAFSLSVSTAFVGKLTGQDRGFTHLPLSANPCPAGDGAVARTINSPSPVDARYQCCARYMLDGRKCHGGTIPHGRTSTPRNGPVGVKLPCHTSYRAVLGHSSLLSPAAHSPAEVQIGASRGVSTPTPRSQMAKIVRRDR